MSYEVFENDNQINNNLKIKDDNNSDTDYDDDDKIGKVKPKIINNDDDDDNKKTNNKKVSPGRAKLANLKSSFSKITKEQVLNFEDPETDEDVYL